MTRGLTVLLISMALVSCTHQVMGVVPAPRQPVHRGPLSFQTSTQVLQKMRADCYFCSPAAQYLDECLLIVRSDRAAARLMRVSELAPNLQPPGIPSSLHTTTGTAVWVAAVAGLIRVSWTHDVQWAVLVLAYQPGFEPQIAVLGPALDGNTPGPSQGGTNSWPAFYDALPDLSASG